MFEIKGYETISISQHDTINGGVPAAIEWLLRFHGIDVGDSKEFQTKYTTINGGVNRNNFDSVSKLVKKDYPGILFKLIEFKTGEEKIRVIEDLIESQTPVLISIITGVSPSDNVYHIVPVTKVDDSNIWITLINEPKETSYSKKDLINRHNSYPGGNDILYIEKGTFAT